jgi:outer membrane protein assembly factor BamD (BamD/ComL family)
LGGPVATEAFAVKTFSIRSIHIIVCAITFVGCATTEADWREAQERGTRDAYEQFLKQHPRTEFSPQAKQSIEKLDWIEATKTNTKRSYQQFLDRHPAGQFRQNAHDAIAGFDWESAKKTHTIAGYKQFLNVHPAGRFASEATMAISTLEKEKEDAAYRTIAHSKSRVELASFLKQYPNTTHKDAVLKRLALFSERPLTAPLLVPYKEFGLATPLSGAEAERMVTATMGMRFLTRGHGDFIAINGIVVVHAGTTLPSNPGFDVSSGKLLLKPMANSLGNSVKVTSLDGKGFCVLDSDPIIPVGTEVGVPQDEWVQWGKMEFMGGKIRLLETGIELSEGTKIMSPPD